jgi:hypothetical protein
MEIIANHYLKKDSQEKIDYLLNLVSKQNIMYDMCANKVSTLATISAIFIGAIIILISRGGIIDQTSNIDATALVLNKVIVLLPLLFFLISLAISIWYVGPDKIINPKWIKMKDVDFMPNHRAVYGIVQHNSIKGYKKYISTLTAKDICNHIIGQIYVLNEIIWSIQRKLILAVIFNLIGIAGFAIILLIYFTQH